VVTEPEFKFVVRLDLKSEIRLRQGTCAIARSKGFAGTRYIELTPPADQAAPFLTEGAFLKTVRETDIVVKANEVMGEARDAFQRFEKEKLTEEISATVKNARASFSELNRVLANMNALIQENRDALKASLEQTKGITTKTNDILARQGDAIERISKNIDQASVHLPAILVNIEELTAEVKRHPWRLLRKGEPDAPPAKLDHKHPEAGKPN